MTPAQDQFATLKQELAKVVVGQEQLIDRVLLT